MKWVVGALVLVNAGLFLWATGHKGLAGTSEPARAVVNAESMQLISETRPPATAASPAAGARLCFRIGPFVTENDMDRAGQHLYELAVPFNRRNVPSRDIRTYRVYLGPFTTDSAIEAQRDLLRAGGVTDHYVKREPGGNDIISLGLFSQQSSAERMRAELEKKNFKPSTRPEDRALGATYWLELTNSDANKRARADLAASQWPEPRAVVKQFPCT